MKQLSVSARFRVLMRCLPTYRKDGTGLELLPDYLGRHPDGAFYVLTSIDAALKDAGFNRSNVS